MTYWQIFKNRRHDLSFSSKTIARQMGVPEEALDAIENNQLNYFMYRPADAIVITQRYAEMLGVNYYAIEEDVVANVESYARRRGIPMEGYSKPVQKTQTVTVKTKSGTKKRKLTPAQAKKLRQKKLRLKRKRQKRIKQLIILFVFIAGIGLVGLNFVRNQKAERALAQAEKEKQTELQQKEAETQRLAEQKQNGNSSSENENGEIKIESNGNNTFNLSNIGQTTNLQFKVMLPQDSIINLYENDQPLVEGTSFSGSFTYSVNLQDAKTIELQIENYSDGEISINGQTVEFNKLNWAEGTPAVLVFNIEENQDENTQDSNTDTQTDLQINEADTNDVGTFNGDYDNSGN